MAKHLSALWLICASVALAAPPTSQPATAPSTRPVVPPGFRLTATKYYNIVSNMDAQAVREADVRLSFMYEEYQTRTKGFAGKAKDKLPFYLFAEKEEYHAAGGMPGSAGMFVGHALAAYGVKATGGGIAYVTWRTLQHEGFHQFCLATVGNNVPMWINEGLAEYFAEGIFTGDALVTGMVSPSRLQRIQAMLRARKHKPLEEMMALTMKQWNKELDIDNYDQAWSMIHFLGHGEDGKYQAAFNNFMKDMSRGDTWQKAWKLRFGASDGFEKRWAEYWSKLQPNVSAELYTKTILSIMASFIARAATQNQNFDTLDAFLATDPARLKMHDEDWIPHTLLEGIPQIIKDMKRYGYKFQLENAKTKSPYIACVMPHGVKMMTKSSIRFGKVDKVWVDVLSH